VVKVRVNRGHYPLVTWQQCYIMVFAIQLYKAYYLVGSLYYNYYFSYLPIAVFDSGLYQSSLGMYLMSIRC
jgi:hypothetical protein